MKRANRYPRKTLKVLLHSVSDSQGGEREDRLRSISAAHLVSTLQMGQFVTHRFRAWIGNSTIY